MISASLTNKIESYGLDVANLESLISHAFAEDIPDGDDKTTIATITPEQVSKASLRVRKDGVVAGVFAAAAVFETVGISQISHEKECGQKVSAGDTILVIEGKTRNILRSERIALNFLCHLSGIATMTRKYVDAVAGTNVTIRDTRKTTPGLRQLEKFAVRMGGGMNHRMNLSDGSLVKDNHIAAAGSVTSAVNRMRSEFPGMELEVEVDNLDQLREAIACNVEIVMLDNMDIATTKEAVRIAAGSRTKLESSGGITLENLRAYAETGVTYIAIGALTHSAPSLDFGLDF